MKENCFKKSDLGLIPNDWVVKTIKSFASITTGNRNTQDADDSGQYPFFVRSPIVERIREFGFDTEGVITAGDGVGTGKVFHYINGKFGLHQRCYLIYNFKNIDAQFFYKNFSLNFYERVHTMTAKSSVDSVRMEMIADMLIAMPQHISEQRRIAKALSDVDGLLISLDKLIEKKRNIKIATMQQLLTGKTRLKGFNEPWINKNVNEVCSISARIGWQGLKTSEYLSHGDSYLITGTDFQNGFIQWDICHFVSEWRYKQDPKIQVCVGDVLITKDGTIGKVAYVNKLPNKATLNSGVFVVRSKNNKKLSEIYLSLIFKSVYFENFIKHLQAGSTIVHLYQKDFIRFVLHFPSDITEQTAIARIITDIESEINILEKKRAKYEAIKKGMMQQLLTGKIRLI